MIRAIRTEKIERIANLFRYLGDPSRCILIHALERESAGLYVHEIAEILGVTHSAASHQLGSLEAWGIVERVREGQLVRYTLSRSVMAKRAVRLLRAAGR